MKKTLPVLLFLFICHLLFAQQDAQFSMYRFNGLFLNPAYTGSHNDINAVAMYRTQWLGIPGAPQTGTIGLSSPFNSQDRVALGGIYTFDKIGVSQTNAANVSFAYRLPIGRKKDIRLCFGLSGGFENYHTNFSNIALTQPGDPNFEAGPQNRWMPEAAFGVYIYSQRFFAGASLSHLLTNRLTGEAYAFQVSSDIAHEFYDMNVEGGYVLDVSEKVKFIPAMLVQTVPAHTPVTFNFNASFVFIDRICVGMAYRLNDSYDFMLAVNVTRAFRIGYCYDLVVSTLGSQTTGSHEVMLSVDFAAAKGKLTNPAHIIWF